MINFQRIPPDDFRSLTFIRAVYETSFPEAERRPVSEYSSLHSTPNYKLEILRLNDRPAGFFSSWRLEAFTFIEHFAISEPFRGQGIGSDALSTFIAHHAEPIILEVEPPATGEKAKRRIGFYQRLGFHFNAVAHIQPPYIPEGSPVKLNLMSYPAPVYDYEPVREALYRQVYGL